jgi:hypothetical protein
MSEPAGAAIAGQVSAVSFTPATTYAHATGRWTVSFETSSTGALKGANGDAFAILFPGSFGIPSTPSAVLSAGFTGSCSGSQFFGGPGIFEMNLQSGCNIAASTVVTVILKGVTNPAAKAFQASRFQVTTTQDQPTISGSTGITIIPQTAPGAPTGVLTTPLNTHARVTWTPPTSNGGSVITSYSVVARDPSNAVAGKCSQVGSPPAVDGCTIFGLTNGVTYTVRVKATNAIGSSAASTEVTVTPS